eukprot:CAMPEP_0182914828 /NCGR_PEP_ID=MMETSP0034_2-20130328/38772_1 /TAXON_ID=156128 /ORGANISM="Nephroselmis pyriformis, Strain CCMP717" /LENGTH=539 /DNA_ID=CAMNT_0025051619 /DNA_START=153 /DNA_END=1769 /DNA_ORIENTATION=+
MSSVAGSSLASAGEGSMPKPSTDRNPRASRLRKASQKTMAARKIKKGCDLVRAAKIPAFEALEQDPKERSTESVVGMAEELSKLNFFKAVPIEYLTQVAIWSTFRLVPRRRIVCLQGDPTESLYVVLKGSISVRIDYSSVGMGASTHTDKEMAQILERMDNAKTALQLEAITSKKFGLQIAELHEGACFGELQARARKGEAGEAASAVPYRMQCSVLSKQKLYLLEISPEVYRLYLRKFIGNATMGVPARFRKTLRMPPQDRTPADVREVEAHRMQAYPGEAFSMLPEIAQQRLARGLVLRTLPAGTILYKEGTEAEAMFVVLKGRVGLLSSGALHRNAATGKAEPRDFTEKEEHTSGGVGMMYAAYFAAHAADLVGVTKSKHTLKLKAHRHALVRTQSTAADSLYNPSPPGSPFGREALSPGGSLKRWLSVDSPRSARSPGSRDRANTFSRLRPDEAGSTSDGPPRLLRRSLSMNSLSEECIKPPPLSLEGPVMRKSRSFQNLQEGAGADVERPIVRQPSANLLEELLAAGEEAKEEE